ncbi:hypothetical protein A6A06_03155 [Streptomyces sp. CB02923]|uniref:DUF6113 family protein n=1 Tax=Streptomyces sp. CB02923 TaxID=1718985 RepID=UPI00093F36C9|nr:DUF6113 family protein [Streptomyces sp. CB02923]OKI09673.1 hypothetical protein A6A06_03155 [Streptomyces sp. CB02923]
MSGAKKRTRATTGGKGPKTGASAVPKGGRGAAAGAGAGKAGTGKAVAGKAGTGGTAAATGLAAPLSPGRVGAYVLLFVLGAVVATAGGLVQAAWFPGGLLLALAAAGALFYGGALALGRTGGVLAPGAGWLVSVILLSDSRPEGDFLFGAGLGTYVFLVGGIVLAVICATGSQMRANGAQAARLGK